MLRGLAIAFLVVTGPVEAAPRVYPSSDTVPENLLRIEIELDHPLWAPLDMRHVQLVGTDGKPISDALLDLPLLSRDSTEVSILLHPGRIKTGVGPNLMLGLALRRGETVSLVIDDPQLGSPLRKSWRVVPALREPIDPASWKIASPSAGTRGRLTVDFPAALDSSAEGLLAIAAPDGRRVMGRARLSNGETRWMFVPDVPWEPGRYQVRAHPHLEDPAGNRVCSAFEQIEQSRVRCNEDARVSFILTSRQSKEMTEHGDSRSATPP
jgi:hypothetical protein